MAPPQRVHQVRAADTVAAMLAFRHRPPATAPLLPPPSWAGVATAALHADDLGPAQAPQCLSCHALMLVNAGHATVEVDFVPRPCRPGSLLWLRAGQAIRVDSDPDLHVTLVTWEPGLATPEDLTGLRLDDPFGPGHWQLSGDDAQAMIDGVSQLAADFDRHGHGSHAPAAALLRHELIVLLLRVALLAMPASHPMTSAEMRTFARFQRELEARYPLSRRVEDYAGLIGCSVRTLTRASLAATGRSAKQVVDDRVALAAKRLLACSDEPVAEVGRLLGFPEPTNFGRFFHREVGVSPGAFRAGIQGTRRVPAPRRPPDEG